MLAALATLATLAAVSLHVWWTLLHTYAHYKRPAARDAISQEISRPELESGLLHMPSPPPSKYQVMRPLTSSDVIEANSRLRMTSSFQEEPLAESADRH